MACYAKQNLLAKSHTNESDLPEVFAIPLASDNAATLYGGMLANLGCGPRQYPVVLRVHPSTVVNTPPPLQYFSCLVVVARLHFALPHPTLDASPKPHQVMNSRHQINQPYPRLLDGFLQSRLYTGLTSGDYSALAQKNASPLRVIDVPHQ